ncbi:hypothetical protein AB5J56_00825 [Streptomyces sp. R21]|uniref:Uncharacterized protein n=1 Tax=Streptomyces sp. R21 TaxID=3238627 RepID=A0AB39NZ43_9ACTN
MGEGIDLSVVDALLEPSLDQRLRHHGQEMAVDVARNTVSSRVRTAAAAVCARTVQVVAAAVSSEPFSITPKTRGGMILSSPVRLATRRVPVRR